MFSVAIVALVVAGKMKWLKHRIRLSVFLSLGIGTLVLYGISTIVSNMFNVFLIALISWSVYCIEYLIAQLLVQIKS